MPRFCSKERDHFYIRLLLFKPLISRKVVNETKIITAVCPREINFFINETFNRIFFCNNDFRNSNLYRLSVTESYDDEQFTV